MTIMLGNEEAMIAVCAGDAEPYMPMYMHPGLRSVPCVHIVCICEAGDTGLNKESGIRGRHGLSSALCQHWCSGMRCMLGKSVQYVLADWPLATCTDCVFAVSTEKTHV